MQSESRTQSQNDQVTRQLNEHPILTHYLSANRPLSICGKLTTNAICLSCRNAGTYMSLQMHMIGRRSSCFALPFPFAVDACVFSPTNLSRKSMDCTGAPSISSGMIVTIKTKSPDKTPQQPTQNDAIRSVLFRQKRFHLRSIFQR